MHATTVDELEATGISARGVARELAALSTETKDRALWNIAGALRSHVGEVLEANEVDRAAAARNGEGAATVGRLLLTRSGFRERLDSMAEDVLSVA